MHHFSIKSETLKNIIAIDCVSNGIFESAKTLYIKEVVESVAVSATHYPEDCVKFAKLVLPALAEGLLNQRGEFY